MASIDDSKKCAVVENISKDDLNFGKKLVDPRLKNCLTVTSVPLLATSTPKKDGEQNILDTSLDSSQLIINESLLSSIDDLRENELDNSVDVTSSDVRYVAALNKKELTSRPRSNCELDVKLNRTLNSNLRKSQSFSGAINSKHLNQSIYSNKVAINVPISPMLRNRVRQRLFTLVNEIDGYQNDGKVLTDPKEEYIPQTNQNNIQSETACHHLRSRWENNDFSYSSMKSSCHNQSAQLSERYGNVMNNVLETQFSALRLQQEELYQQKLTLEMEQHEQKWQQQTDEHQLKIKEMFLIIQALEAKIHKLESESQNENFRLREEKENLDGKHKNIVQQLNSDWHKKMLESETEAMAREKQIQREWQSKIETLLSTVNDRILVSEKEYCENIKHLSNVITQLKAEKFEMEMSFKSQMNSIRKHSSLDDCQQMTSVKHTRLISDGEVDALKDLIKGVELKNTELREEVKVWREEVERVNEILSSEKKSHALQIQHLLKNTNFNAECWSSAPDGDVSASSLRARALMEEVSLLKCNLKEALMAQQSSTAALEQQHSRVILEIQKRHEQEMLHLQTSLETKISQVANESEALLNKEKEMDSLIHQVETRCHQLIKSVQSHANLQIREYQKAVKILKKKLSRLEAASKE